MTAPAADAAQDRPRRKLYTQLWFWVIVGIVAGIVFGLVAARSRPRRPSGSPTRSSSSSRRSRGPVIFVTVVIGIASLGNVARAGGLALRALGYFFTMTVVALALGLIVGNIVQPGSGFEG